LPVVDKLAEEYADRVAFVAPAWKASFEATASRASELMPSGAIQWGLDEQEIVFQAYGVPYQPVTVLIGADGTVVDSWAGALGESELRTAIEGLLTS
jgi:hypothetical protein